MTVDVTVDSARSQIAAPGRLWVGIAGCTPAVSGGDLDYTYTYARNDAPVPVAEALSNTERSFALLDTLDIVGAQTGALSYSVLRNSGLARPFRYATAPASLPKPILPHVEHRGFFDVSSATGSGMGGTLSDYLTTYFVDLLSTSIPNPAASLKLQVTLEVAFPAIPYDFDFPLTARPIGFLTAQNVTIGISPGNLLPLVTSLCEQVVAWSNPFGNFDPNASPWCDLFLRIDTTLYAEWQAAPTTPLLSLKGGCLPMFKLKDLS
jgi:hypothetical protein